MTRLTTLKDNSSPVELLEFYEKMEYEIGNYAEELDFQLSYVHSVLDTNRLRGHIEWYKQNFGKATGLAQNEFKAAEEAQKIFTMYSTAKTQLLVINALAAMKRGGLDDTALKIFDEIKTSQDDFYEVYKHSFMNKYCKEVQ